MHPCNLFWLVGYTSCWVQHRLKNTQCCKKYIEIPFTSSLLMLNISLFNVTTPYLWTALICSCLSHAQSFQVIASWVLSTYIIHHKHDHTCDWLWTQWPVKHAETNWFAHQSLKVTQILVKSCILTLAICAGWILSVNELDTDFWHIFWGSVD